MTEPHDGWTSRTIIATAGGGAAATATFSWISWLMADSPGSDFPAWLSAWATVFGVAAAIVAGFYAARAFRLEFIREQRWEESQRTAQASLVAAWWGTGPGPAPPQRGTFEAAGLGWGGSRRPSGIFLRNASEVPVTEVDIVVTRADIEMEIDWINVGVLPPSQTPTFRAPEDPNDGMYNAAFHSGSDPAVTIIFTDAAGQRWQRSPDGALSPSDRVGRRSGPAQQPEE